MLDLCIHQHNPDTFHPQCYSDFPGNSVDTVRNSFLHDILLRDTLFTYKTTQLCLAKWKLSTTVLVPQSILKIKKNAQQCQIKVHYCLYIKTNMNGNQFYQQMHVKLWKFYIIKEMSHQRFDYDEKRLGPCNRFF